MKSRNRTLAITALTALALSLGQNAFAQTESTLVPYLATGYKFKVVPFNGDGGFELPGFDDSSFSTGDAGFGTPWGGCSLNNPTDIKTFWPLGTDILLRKWFSLPPGASNLRVSVAIDNDVQVFLNGQDISSGLQLHEGCPARDSFVFSAPDSILISGSNLLAVRARDRGVLGYADVKITASINQPPVANAGTDQTPECSNPAGTPVTLDGSASTDSDDDTLTYTWTGPFPEGGGTVTGVNPTVTLPLGVSTITLVVNDGTVDSAPDSVDIHVQVFVSGLQPPMVALSPEGWPPFLPTRAFKQGSTIPLKLQLFCSGVVLTNADVAPPRIVELFVTGGPIDLTTVDIDAGAANDSGIDFRFSDPSWVYNLSTQGLSSGTYTITIQMPDGRRFHVGFVLK